MGEHVILGSVAMCVLCRRRSDVRRSFTSGCAKLDASQFPSRPSYQGAEVEVENVQSRTSGSTRCTLQTEDRASPKSVSRDGRLE